MLILYKAGYVLSAIYNNASVMLWGKIYLSTPTCIKLRLTACVPVTCTLIDA
jgi:hypothetical protein